MKVRVASLDDLDICKHLAQLAVENSPYRKFVDDNHLHDVCLYYLSADPRESITFLLCTDNGKAVGLLTAGKVGGPSIVASGNLAAELVWYVTPEERKGIGPMRLVKAFERWAKLTGCKRVVMSCFSDDMREPLTRLYNKLGYKSMEEAFLKEL